MPSPDAAIHISQDGIHVDGQLVPAYLDDKPIRIERDAQCTKVHLGLLTLGEVTADETLTATATEHGYLVHPPRTQHPAGRAMPVLPRRGYLRPAIFGSFDGLTSVLGVLFSVTGHSHLAFWVALSLGAAECVGMTFGEWLSDSSNGFGAAAVIGLATMAGSVLPAVPYLVLVGTPAIVASLVVLLLVGLAITWARSAERGWRRAIMETYGILVIATVTVIAIQQLTPAGA